ncbi:anti-sigma factor family protein [Planosporangium sp. 12N6]|uniref:anti-sigma factor family protein n=1 Tax=Planosporangium spinosum TaxID=3402278 RepID=UPI003CF92479
MMMPEDVHRDVGAYALGVLDPRDRARFEKHLTVCRSCPRELEELSSVAALLSRVTADELTFAEHSVRKPRQVDALLLAVRDERRRTAVRQAYTLAACLVLIVAGAVVAVSVGLGGRGLPGVPALSPVAQKLHAADPATGAEATVQLEAKRWGSQVTLQMTHVNGPVTCRLVAVSRAGANEVVMGWSVPPTGYGTAQQPDPLVLHGGTGLQPDDVSRFEVRTTNGTLLVSVSR